MGDGGNGGGGDGGVWPSYPDATRRSTEGTANTGGGGGGGASNPVTSPGRTGGSGVVIVKEPEVTFLEGTSSCWDLRKVFTEIKSGNWT
jgi:hypothetical protein